MRKLISVLVGSDTKYIGDRNGSTLVARMSDAHRFNSGSAEQRAKDFKSSDFIKQAGGTTLVVIDDEGKAKSASAKDAKAPKAKRGRPAKATTEKVKGKPGRKPKAEKVEKVASGKRGRPAGAVSALIGKRQMGMLIEDLKAGLLPSLLEAIKAIVIPAPAVPAVATPSARRAPAKEKAQVAAPATNAQGDQANASAQVQTPATSGTPAA